MIVFCHIPKTAGMAVKYVLKSNLGNRFVSSTTWGKARAMTTARDLRYELLPYPRAEAIGGHGMRPFVDYGPLGRDFRWITILRDPITRLVSHYVYDHEHGRTTDSFATWLEGDVGNYQVRWLAGEEDLERARELLETKFVLVGLQERFRESLILLKHLVFADHLHLSSERRVNATRSIGLKEQVEAEVPLHSALIEEKCGLDVALYEHARQSIWKRQVHTIGAEELSRRLATEFNDATAAHRGRRARLCHDVYRSVAYKPVLCAARLLGARK